MRVLVASILFTVFSILTTLESQAQEPIPYERVDIRDLATYGFASGAVLALLERLETQTCDFVAPVLESQIDVARCSRLVKWYKTGAHGPSTQDNSETRKNTIFSVEIEKMISKNNATTLQLLFFIHDESQYKDSKNLFFRRIEVQFDRTKMTKITHLKDIPLNQTFFSFYADVLDRKTVLVDEKNEIVKVFPVAVGSFDIRNFKGTQTYVASLTPELTQNAMIYVGQSSGLYEARTDKNNLYKGRPFLGIMDEDGTVYTEIGWHYQMSEDPLERGFLTHGCLRTEDKNLYQMAAIVFSHLQPTIPVKVVTDFAFDEKLKHLDHWKHPMPMKNDAYYSVGYIESDVFSKDYLSKVRSDIQTFPQGTFFSDVEQYLWCQKKANTSFNHSESHRPGLRTYGEWITALDSYCLTKIGLNRSSVEPVIHAILDQKMKGLISEAPQTLFLKKQYPVIIKGLCDGTLREAQKIFSQFDVHRRLTYRVYISNCGCGRLTTMLEKSVIKDPSGGILDADQKKQMILKYCPE